MSIKIQTAERMKMCWKDEATPGISLDLEAVYTI